MVLFGKGEEKRGGGKEWSIFPLLFGERTQNKKERRGNSWFQAFPILGGGEKRREGMGLSLGEWEKREEDHRKEKGYNH